MRSARLLGPLLASLLALAAVRAAATPAPSPAPARAAVNEAFGLTLWSDESLWTEDAATVARRLGLAAESQTATESSYRRYPDDQTRVLGSRPFSIALYATTAQVTQLSLVFINKGDYVGSFQSTSLSPTQKDNQLRQEFQRRLRGFDQAFRQEAKTIEAALTNLFGTARRSQFGQTTKTSERVDRWDWQGHAILLATPRDEYIAVRIVPTAVADSEGRTERIRDAALKEMLGQRVRFRPNGDVIIADLPMVNQGQKGFCVPATWERYLRYLGIPVDMYTLAMAGETIPGSGTYLTEMVKGIDSLVGRYGRQLDKASRSLNLNNIAHSIDKGLPLMWTMRVHQALDYQITTRSRERKKVTDWADWVEQLKPARREVRRLNLDRDATPHMCLIIGYNERTKEIATSDSWGPEFAERWLTVEEAMAISLNEFYVVKW